VVGRQQPVQRVNTGPDEGVSLSKLVDRRCDSDGCSAGLSLAFIAVYYVRDS
jgi:hypothetical protein